MNIKIFNRGLLIVCASLFTLCSHDRAKTDRETLFTKADSLTGTYLSLQDSMLQGWYTMIHDDNVKIKAMHHLLHELSASNPERSAELAAIEERLEHLKLSRYDQRSISEAELVSEYDFASNALVSELITLAETRKEFAYDPTLQKLVEMIRSADQRVNNYREEYDHVTSRYNRFIEKNRNMLQEANDDSLLEKKPLFQMASE